MRKNTKTWLAVPLMVFLATAGAAHGITTTSTDA